MKLQGLLDLKNIYNRLGIYLKIGILAAPQESHYTSETKKLHSEEKINYIN